MLLKSCDMIVQNRGGCGQGPFEHCVEEISVLIEDGFQILQSLSEEEKSLYLTLKVTIKSKGLKLWAGTSTPW